MTKGVSKGDYEFADDALVDEDWDGEAEEADKCEAAAGPAKVELEVLAAGVPVLDPPVLVHLHAASHLLLSSVDLPRCEMGISGRWRDSDLVWRTL
jgi:hypothetical protein